MAIYSIPLISCNKILPMPGCSGNVLKKGNLPSRMANINSTTNGSIVSITSQLRNSFVSPYLVGDTSQPTSRVIDKKAVKVKTDNVPSCPLAVDIYKANSDEFKPIKYNRKMKKSILTLPNEQNSTPERCTVSDMNDSEYVKKDNASRKVRPKKRTPCQSNTKCRGRKNADLRFYNVDARYRSHLNIDLDSSATDMIRHFDGDGKIASHIMKPQFARKPRTEKQFRGHDVWKVLQNMNRFQFRPSPPASDDTIVTTRKKKGPKRYKRKDTRLIETCRTEEFAYISSIEVDSKSKNFSQSSSFDRITVIDKEDDFSKIYDEFERTVVKTHNLMNNVNVNNYNRGKNKIHIKNKPRANNKLCTLKDKQIKSIDYTAAVMRKENMFRDENYNGKYNVSSENINRISKIPVGCFKDHRNVSNLEDKEESDDTDELRDKFICSGNSGSSKAACNYSKGNEKLLKPSSDESSQHIKGITKVVLSKDQDILQANRMDLQKRKLRLFTTIPSTMIIPKLTQTDIKRKLANIKFPLVILDKDQVSSTMQLIDFYDHPQFSGLDKHIWPFMLEWNRDFTKSYNNVENDMHQTKHYTAEVENKYKNLHKSSKIVKSVTKENINHNVTSFINNKITEEDRSITEIKQKPIHNIKDKVVKLLYKNSSATNLHEITHQAGGGDEKNITSNNFSTENNIGDCRNLKRSPTTKKVLKKRHKAPVDAKDRLSVIKISRTKSSDLVDTVIMNIENGVYYNEDQKCFENKHDTISEEASLQTTLIDILEVRTDQVECVKLSAPKEISNKYYSLVETIPGFDYALPELEIKTVNFNKIEIKDCLSNILVQFDVITLPMNPTIYTKGFKKSYSFVPLEVTDHETKVFKCKTSILNAMLPSELCSIVPKMMRNLITSEAQPLALVPMNKTESNLSTISELSHCENARSCNVPQVYTPLHLRCLFDGSFFKPIKTNSKEFINKFDWVERTRNVDLLPILTNKLVIPCDLCPKGVIFIRGLRNATSLKSQGIGESLIQKQKICTTVQSYNLRNWSVAMNCKPYDFNDMISRIWACYNDSSFIVTPTITTISLITFDISANRLNVKITLNKENQEKVFANPNDLQTDTKYGNFSNMLSNKRENFNGNITDIIAIPVSKKASVNQVKRSATKLRRKGYVKLYKKCKSTTNIPSERHSTVLNKIDHLDDFFQLLGWRKSFSSVFDGHLGQKIMSSLTEMKNWISEINSRQALLVLLLVNKKDTPNLVRFRSILLQGIAVNRITRVSELDMEIEVIERENLNSSLQIEGISYLPASIENKDNLLEELYWIAKTTASDYQRPFDESSEKLLKSLLEKRKKLNPSYLRLMARYVGLGLLKSPLRK